VGDIITFFDGNKVNQASDLLPMVGITPIGSNPSIVIKRNGKEVKGNIKITAQTKKKTKIKLGVYLPRVGFSVGELDKEELKLLGIKNGVKITAVRKSFAHLEGFVDGDILISFNFKKIHTVSGLIDNISIIPDRKRISVRVFRNNKTFFLSALVK
jgi:S1-C subfamily serine protease